MNHVVIERAARWLGAFLLVFTASCGGGSGGGGPGPAPVPVTYTYQPPVAEADGWTVASADSDAATILEDMMTAVLNGNFDYIDSIVIAHDGKLILEETIRTRVDDVDARVGNTDVRMHAQFSASKSVTSLLVGIAIDQGFIAGVDTPYLDLFSYPSYQNWDVRKQDITLHHVLAMRLGLDWDEWDPPYTSPDNQLNRFYEEEVDFSKALLDLPMVADPGTAFAYNTAATVSLGQAIENSVPMSLVDYGIGNLMMPLSITAIEILTTPTGLPNGGGGMYVRTRDMAKFGQLVLDNGEWNGTTVISPAWLETMLETRTEIGWDDPASRPWKIEGYAYQWWNGWYEIGSRQYTTHVAWGFGGQWVVVIPELRLSVAINSHGYDGAREAVDQAHRLVRDYIIDAVD